MLKEPRPAPRRLLAAMAAAVLAGAAGCATQPPQSAQAEAGPAPEADPLPANVLPAPPYPQEALASGTSGRVVLRLLVATDGSVRDAVVEESTPPGVFDAVTLEAAREWTVRPRVEDGRPVEGWMRVPVDFDIDDPGSIILAKVLHAPPPRYPEQALAQRITGRVQLLLTLGADGGVRRAEVVESTPVGVFDAAAKEAAMGWKFAPAVLDGRATGSQVRVPIDFDLPGSGSP